jgi:hypothetical protein
MDAHGIAVLYLLSNFGSEKAPTAKEYIEQVKKQERLEAILEAVWMQALSKVHSIMKQWPNLTDEQRHQMLKFDVELIQSQS